MMKLLFLVVSLFLFSCGRNLVVTEEDIGTDVFYSGNSYKPYSGKCTVFYRESDQIKSEYTFRHGILHGETTSWHNNGQLKRKGNYRNGQLSGCWLFYDAQGHKIMEAHYKNNNLNGTYTTLYADGRTHISGHFSNEALTGQWKEYNEKGQVDSSEFKIIR